MNRTAYIDRAQIGEALQSPPNVPSVDPALAVIQGRLRQMIDVSSMAVDRIGRVLTRLTGSLADGATIKTVANAVRDDGALGAINAQLDDLREIISGAEGLADALDTIV